MTTEMLIPLMNSVVAMMISIIALIYTVKTYLLKSGASVRGSFGMCSSNVACEDQYVTSITLENLKDRAIVIFKIFQGWGCAEFCVNGVSINSVKSVLQTGWRNGSVRLSSPGWALSISC